MKWTFISFAKATIILGVITITPHLQSMETFQNMYQKSKWGLGRLYENIGYYSGLYGSELAQWKEARDMAQANIINAIKAGNAQLTLNLLQNAINAGYLRDLNATITKATGATALHLAVVYEKPSVVTLLLQSGARPDVLNNKSLTPFDLLAIKIGASKKLMTDPDEQIMNLFYTYITDPDQRVKMTDAFIKFV
jgi:hypothetical protein